MKDAVLLCKYSRLTWDCVKLCYAPFKKNSRPYSSIPVAFCNSILPSKFFQQYMCVCKLSVCKAHSILRHFTAWRAAWCINHNASVPFWTASVFHFSQWLSLSPRLRPLTASFGSQNQPDSKFPWRSVISAGREGWGLLVQHQGNPQSHHILVNLQLLNGWCLVLLKT